MPTGNLPAQAEELGVSNEAIFLSIALFVVGFGVGPLVFAPRESGSRDFVVDGMLIVASSLRDDWSKTRLCD